MQKSNPLNMAKKILFVSYDGYDTTNSRVRCYRFSKELRKRGLDSATFSFKDDLHARYDGYQSAKTGIFERATLLIRAFTRLMGEKKGTIFYIQKAGYFALAPYAVHLLKGNSYILDYDDYEYEQSRISRLILKTLAKNAAFCVAASRSLQDFLKKFSKKVHYIPTGVDLDRFSHGRGKLKRKGEVVFAWVGNIVDTQALGNVLFLLDCFDEITKRYPEARLEIAGGGININEVTKRIDELGNARLIYKGVMPPDKIPKYLSKIDIGLFALLDDTKYNRSKSPTKLFEYMAMGLPVISTGIGESGKIIEHGKTGLLASDRKEFIKCAELLIKNPNLRERLGKQARLAAAEKYSLDVLGEELFGIINKEFGGNG